MAALNSAGTVEVLTKMGLLKQPLAIGTRGAIWKSIPRAMGPNWAADVDCQSNGKVVFKATRIEASKRRR